MLLARAPYDHPCDIDPIEKKTATIFFWAAGPCRDAPGFPNETSLVVVTPRAADTPRDAQPITLVAWAGGVYFDDRTNLPIRIGDTVDHALGVLGGPKATQLHVNLVNGKRTDLHLISWARVHVYAVDGRIVAIAMGELDIAAKGERAETLVRLYSHHLRYSRASPSP
jgi:hypothetical protein